ncbi:MAG: peptide MFS transporter [Flammeovirgaceae bacterium]
MSNIDAAKLPDNHFSKMGEWMGHPKGLFILFFTEMWERFSYYGMRAILTLYMIASIADGGLGWTSAEALSLYGTYTMMVYVMSIPGGILADKVLGQKKSVMLGGLLLCAGHGILAVEAEWAFFTGLMLIVLGVGGLKPNISTMVGGLYRQGDIRRDKGFTIFYIGINIGAFLSSIAVAWVADEWGWHYGFGLAGIGMLIGQAVYVWGQKYLVGVGDLLAQAEDPEAKALAQKPLTKIEKDRVVVLLISFLIIIVFWGAFEQAGGLLNIYAQEKIDRNFFGMFEIPAGVFQSVNAFFIITLGTTVAAVWANRSLKGKESSTIFKMAIGTIIMGLGFLMMAKAALEVDSVGKGAMIWLILAYLFHTVGELCASPTALSFITKLAPAKYASIMMGVYFAATGFGNKLAGFIGEEAQSEPIKIVAMADASTLPKALTDSLNVRTKDTPVDGREEYRVTTNVYAEDGEIIVKTPDNQNIVPGTTIEEESMTRFNELLSEYEGTYDNQLAAKITFKQDDENKKQYNGTLVIDQVQNDLELKTFLIITGLTAAFGLLLLLFLKKLKALTHGAEDDEH